MINDKDKKKVQEFLKTYPNPIVKVTSTMDDGFISIIHPIRSICGPELMCSHKTMTHLYRVMDNR